MDKLGAANARKIFGIIEGRIAGTDNTFYCYSAPFVVPRASQPWNDLGEQDYLSITPDLTNVWFTGGDFKLEGLELQRADPNYTDSIKNGWAWRVEIPFSVKNISNQDLVVPVDGIRYYIMGDEKAKNPMMQGGGWYLLKIIKPVLRPGESILGEPSWILSSLEDNGYKPGNKIVAVVAGRIANTNKIFECYSAPFAPPPLPKGEPPAGK